MEKWVRKGEKIDVPVPVILARDVQGRHSQLHR
jgi:hypothetical protein